MAYVTLDVQIMDEWDPLFRIKLLKVILLKVSLANSSHNICLVNDGLTESSFSSWWCITVYHH